MLRSHDAEVAEVEAGDGGDAETLGERDESGVHSAEVLVGVSLVSSATRIQSVGERCSTTISPLLTER